MDDNNKEVLFMQSMFQKFIDANYEDYKNMPADKQEEIKTCFYSGATEMFLTMTIFIPGLPDFLGMIALDGLKEELLTFASEKIREENVKNSFSKN